MISSSPSDRNLSQLFVSVIGRLVTFYDIHRGKREMLFFYFVPDVTRDHTGRVKKYLFGFLLNSPTIQKKTKSKFDVYKEEHCIQFLTNIQESIIKKNAVYYNET
jgi:hypothetical protein